MIEHDGSEVRLFRTDRLEDALREMSRLEGGEAAAAAMAELSGGEGEI